MAYRLIVLQGPSASGKSTLQAKLGFPRVITWTSRAPRSGEVDGRDYCFATRERMLAMEAAGELLEMTDYQGNYYGTSLQGITDALQGEEPRSIVLDAPGARKVKALQPEQVLLLGIYAGQEECRQRLKSRGIPDYELERRMNGYEAELADLRQCDLIIANGEDQLEQAELLLYWTKQGIVSGG